MARTYFIFLLVAGMVAAIMPGGRSTNSVPEAESSETSSLISRRESGSSSTANPSSSGETVLSRDYNGHFYANVEINGSPIRVLVDTGASGIALSRSDAHKAGLAVSAGMFEVIGEGANGDVHGEYVKLDRVSLGSTKVEDVAAVVLDEGEQSLLGQSFLSKFAAVEIRGDTMFLR